MKVLAFDLATVMGVCVGEAGGTPRAWSVDLGQGKSKSEDAKLARLLVVVSKLIADEKPDAIAIEAAVGGPKASSWLHGTVAVARAVAFYRGVPCTAYSLSKVRKHFLGHVPQVRDFPGMSYRKSKSAIKAEVVERCRLLGWEIDGHDAADAAALWDYACALTRTAPSHNSTPLFAARR